MYHICLSFAPQLAHFCDIYAMRKSGANLVLFRLGSNIQVEEIKTNPSQRGSNQLV